MQIDYLQVMSHLEITLESLAAYHVFDCMQIGLSDTGNVR